MASWPGRLAWASSTAVEARQDQPDWNWPNYSPHWCWLPKSAPSPPLNARWMIRLARGQRLPVYRADRYARRKNAKQAWRQTEPYGPSGVLLSHYRALFADSLARSTIYGQESFNLLHMGLKLSSELKCLTSASDCREETQYQLVIYHLFHVLFIKSLCSLFD